jgi:hypothetical protein
MIPKIRYSDWKGMVLYLKEKPFTKKEKTNWEKHYDLKLKQYYAKDIKQYVLGRIPRMKKVI